MGLRDNSILKGEWEIELVEVDRSKEPATEGFDFYIFEHSMPDTMPTDGVVLLVDPDEEPANLGAVLGDFVEGEFQLSAGEPSEITSSLDPSAITSTRYRRVTMHDGFQPLLYIGDDPVLLLKKHRGGKDRADDARSQLFQSSAAHRFPGDVVQYVYLFLPVRAHRCDGEPFAHQPV